MPIYFSWFITALLFGKWWCEQSQPTAKWAPFILRVMGIYCQQRERVAKPGAEKKKKSGGPSTPPKVYRFTLSRDYAAFAKFDRSDRKPARTSSERSWGCSNAAKCPPLSSLL